MSEVTALVVDDEKLGRKRIIDLLATHSGIKIIGECDSAESAILNIQAKSPELVFLDIQLEDATGFDVLQKIRVNKAPLVIFVTAYDEFALKAFDYSAFDYLLKPFSDQRFHDSLKKALNQIQLMDHLEYEKKVHSILKYLETNGEADKNYTNKLPIRTGNKTSFIEKSDIKYVTASGYYAEIYTTGKMYVLRISLQEILLSLSSPQFIRIHRSTIVNAEEILEIIHSDYSEIDVKMSDNKMFRLSKSYKKKFMEYIGI